MSPSPERGTPQSLAVRLALLVLLVILLPIGAYGQEFPESPDSPSAFVTVIEAREYDDRFETVEDVLHHTAGVRVRRYGGLGSYSTASIRGSKGNQVLILLDGVRLNSAYRGDVDLSTLALRNVEQIEVTRGSASTRYGSDAIGGVVSITSRGAGDEGGIDVSGMTGSLETLAGDVLLSHVGERLQSSLVYSRLRSDNDFDFDLSPDEAGGGGVRRGPPPQNTRHTRLNAGFVQNTASFSSSLQTGLTSIASFVAHLQDKDSGQPGSTLGKPVGAEDQQVSFTSPEEQYRRAVLRLGWQDQALGQGSFGVAAFHRYDRWELHDPDHYFFPELVFPDRTRAQIIDTQTGVDLSYVGRRVKWGPLWLSNRTSSTLRIDRVRADDVETKRRWVGNLFSQQEIRMLGGRVRIFPALGVEFADTSSGKARIPGPDLYQEVDVDDDTEWLPSIGGIVQLVPGLRMKSNYRHAYRRPNFSELFHPDYTFLRGNPELDAEESWDFDIGLEFADDGWGPLEDLRLEGVFFHRDIEESIEWVQAYRTVEPHNTGGARARGYEFSGSLLLWDRLDLAGTYTFTSTKIRDSGNPLPYSPRNQIFGRATLRLGRSSLWAELSYEDEHFLTEGGQRRADAVTQIDLGVAVRLVDLPGLRWAPERLSITAECINLTEEPRVDSLGLPLPDERLWYLRLRLASR